MGKNNRKDPAWKYGREIDKSVGDKKSYVYIKCMFCNKTTTGGVKRMKEHLACTHKNVAPCPRVPEDVKKEIQEYMKAGNMQKHLTEQQFEDMVELGSYHGIEKNEKGGDSMRGIRGPRDRFFTNNDEGEETNPKMTVANAKELRNRVCSDIGRFFFENALPFNIIESPSFINMCRAIGSYGRGFRPPTTYELRTWILKEEEESTEKIVEGVKSTWRTSGVSILSDGWSDMRNRSLINFLVNNPEGTVFLKSVDASDAIKDAELMFKLLDDVVEEVGEENVVQVVTDNASNYKAAGRKLMEKRKHLYWTPCAAHCIDLILEKLGELPQHKHALLKAKKVSNFIHNHTWVLALMRKMAKKELLRPGATRFAIAYLTLQRMYELKKPLQAMFTSEQWINSTWAKRSDGKEIKKIILTDKNFWPSVAYALKTTNPLVSVLRLVDSEQMPAMGFIYGAMDNAKEQIAKNLGGKEGAYKEIWAIIDEKWEFQLHRDLHAAGYYLNPRCQYADNFSRHQEVVAGLYKCMLRLIPNAKEREDVDLQLDEFVTKQKFFGLEQAKSTFTKRSPVAWWTQFGDGTPELARFAIRVLSLTCSSSACERNWSTFNQVHTKRRNRLTTKRLEKLVYIMYNKRLKDRHVRLKSLKDGEDPLVVEDISLDDEWIAANVDDEGLDAQGIGSSSHIQSHRKRKCPDSTRDKEKGKGKLLLVDEEDEFIEIDCEDDEEDDGEIRYDDDSMEDATSSDNDQMYKKHHPPFLFDEVWRLEKIGKDGAFHKRLRKERVNTVRDFLILLFLDPARLRNILGMSAKMWEVAAEHAQTCVLDKKLYLYNASGSQQKNGVVFNIVGQVLGQFSGCQYIAADKLSEAEKADARNLVITAYKDWEKVISFDDETSLMDALTCSSTFLSPSNLLPESSCKIDRRAYAQQNPSSPDITQSVCSIGGLSSFDDLFHGFDQPFGFPCEVASTLTCDADSSGNEQLMHLNAGCSLQNSVKESSNDLTNAASRFFPSSVIPIYTAQRRWTKLSSVLKWFIIFKNVVKKTGIRKKPA